MENLYCIFISAFFVILCGAAPEGFKVNYEALTGILMSSNKIESRQIGATLQEMHSRVKRVAGGAPTQLDQFPWTVRVLIDIPSKDPEKSSVNECGGSLISSQFVLTAAHCFYHKGKFSERLKVVLSEYNTATFPKDCKLLPDLNVVCVENIVMNGTVVIHPEHHSLKLENDIALVKLEEPVTFTKYVQPICLPSRNLDDPEYKGVSVALAGFGMAKGYQPIDKQFTTLQLVSHDVCKIFYGDILGDSCICAVGKNGAGACPGDSGSPLMALYEENYYEQVGIYIFRLNGFPCDSFAPAGYTNVYPYLDWIQNYVPISSWPTQCSPRHNRTLIRQWNPMN